MRLLSACEGDTPEAIELKALLKQTVEPLLVTAAQCFDGRAHQSNLLTSAYRNGSAPQKITERINEQFGRDFSVRSVYSKAHKLALITRRAARVVAPKLTKLSPLTAALPFPIGSPLDRINSVVPRHLSRDHRDDVIGQMALAIYEGRLAELDISRRVREFVNHGYRHDHGQHRPLSFDVPLFDAGLRTLGIR